MPVQIVVGLVLGAVVFYPMLRICRRAGLPRPLALLVFIPLVGPLLLLGLLAFLVWPNDPMPRR